MAQLQIFRPLMRLPERVFKPATDNSKWTTILQIPIQGARSSRKALCEWNMTQAGRYADDLHPSGSCGASKVSMSKSEHSRNLNPRGRVKAETIGSEFIDIRLVETPFQ